MCEYLPQIEHSISVCFYVTVLETHICSTKNEVQSAQWIEFMVWPTKPHERWLHKYAVTYVWNHHVLMVRCKDTYLG